MNGADRAPQATAVDDVAAELTSAWARRLRAEGATPATVRTRCDIVAVMRHAGIDPVRCGVADVEGWLAELDRPWTRHTYFVSARAWFDHLLREGARTDHPMADLRRPRAPRGNPRPIPDSDLQRALSSATGDTRAYMLLAAFAGLRVSEVARMRGQAITAQHLRVVGKGRTELYVPTHPLLWDLAGAYPRNGWWFPACGREGHVRASSVTQAIRRHLRSLGIEATAHQLRHSFATRLLRSGADIRVVQQAMRHASLQTTAGYLAVEPAALTAAVASLPTFDDAPRLRVVGA